MDPPSLRYHDPFPNRDFPVIWLIKPKLRWVLVLRFEGGGLCDSIKPDVLRAYETELVRDDVIMVVRKYSPEASN